MSLAPDVPIPSGTPLDLHLASGDLHAEWFGAEHGRLVVCVPGLSANLRGFDFIAERVADPTHRIVALDLRGRGQSQVTGAGTYGWVHHAEDVLEVADILGASRFDVVGQSMGAAVAMEIARLAPQRLGSVVLIDVCGVPDPRTVPLIRAAVERLGSVYPSVETYLEVVQRLGTVRPWSPYWERYFRYELAPVPGGGVRARSDRAAVLEDATYGEEHDPRTLWPYLTSRPCCSARPRSSSTAPASSCRPPSATTSSRRSRPLASSRWMPTTTASTRMRPRATRSRPSCADAPVTRAVQRVRVTLLRCGGRSGSMPLAIARW